jgi:superoxide reductase
MTKLNEIHKCDLCGNITEILHSGGGALICCGQEMALQAEKSKEEGTEKHLPTITDLPKSGVKVNVGEVAHPMEDSHYIEWVEIQTVDSKVGKKFLNPGDSTEMEFHTEEKIKEVRAYCNVHGLWKITL